MIQSVVLLAAVGLGASQGSGLEAGPAIGLAALLLCCSAFFSGSETALFSLQPIDRESMPHRDRVDPLLADPRRTLASLLIGNELANLTLSTVTAGLLFTLVPDKPWLNVVVLTPIVLLLGEVLPKVLALKLNRRLAPLIAGPLRIFAKIVAPLRIVLTRIADASLLLTGGSTAPRQAALREAHFKALVEQGKQSGNLNPVEQEMIERVFAFGDKTVSRRMTPRPDMFTLSLSTPWDELLAAVRRNGYSRVPIWQGKPENIVGILLVKDLLPVLAEVRDGQIERPTAKHIQSRLRPARFVPTSKRAEDMLSEFKRDKFHQAIVVDEHGSVAGLVTLDDLLGELVGDLLDENDAIESEVNQISSSVFSVRAGMDIDDFATRFQVEVPPGDYTTLGGFALSLYGAVPEKGGEVKWEGLRFTVSGLDGRRVTDLMVELVGSQP